MINNYGKKRHHDLHNLIVIETNTLYIIPHNLINDANICYKSSLLTYIDKNLNYLVIKINQTDNFKEFINKPKNI